MSDDVHYDEKIIAFLEDLWGDGFLSPGGAEEVRRVLDGVTISDKSVIDIGCGSGAVQFYWLRNVVHVVLLQLM